MSIFFDEDYGILVKTVDDIVNKEIEWLENNTNIRIEGEANIYKIIAKSLALIKVEILEAMNDFFKSTTEREGKFYKALKEVLTIASTTYDAVLQRLLQINEVKHANIISTSGTVAIYLILHPEYKAYIDTSDASKLAELPNNPTDADIAAYKNISDFKGSVWKALYDTAPVGTHYQGEIEIDGKNQYEQIKKYKFTLGKVKYAYLHVTYTMDLKNTLYMNVDSEIRKIYQRIIKNNYKNMGHSFEYQDFHAPVNEVNGIKSMEIKVAIKDTDEYPINDTTNIKPSDYKTNEDVDIKDSEFLNISCIRERLKIDLKV